ncbi:hypothetical protein GCM10009092_14150 [Bowmanella denitrificans]|uniref:Outer membrane protein beta-barrel domain-containing protein n=1 Tax=Bowmanella denitrificans TaxID=366582 RepID=A0ABP3GNL4_9ALTE
MKKTFRTTLLSFTLLSSVFVSAENNWYTGALYSKQDISITGRDFNTAGLLVGYTYNQYLSLEARLAKGTSGYSSFYGTPESPYGRYKEDINVQTSALVKLSYPIIDDIKLYGLIGYSRSELEIKGTGQIIDSEGNITGEFPSKHNISENGLSYGVGISCQVNDSVDLFIDYQVLPDFEPMAAFSRSWKSASLGINYHF